MNDSVHVWLLILYITTKVWVLEVRFLQAVLNYTDKINLPIVFQSIR